MATPYEKLGDVLEKLLENRESHIKKSSPNMYPLFLLLTVKSDIIGFAVSDGQPEENFSKALQNFKELYSNHSSEWVDFDLTLVFCLANGEFVTDEFYIEKEQDPYFCRKFVIDLKKDLKSELSRLPFIPLAPERLVGLKRPISAQTFLMKNGVKSEFARSIVIPYARSREGIISACLKGEFGKPIWPGVKVKEFRPMEYEMDRPNVRLKNLEINNFRAFRGKHSFDLDANVVILFGPNGLGKTSLFDAIDFVCTGGVARLDDRLVRKSNRLVNALTHLDEPMEDSYVKMIASGSDDISIERYVRDRKHSFLNGVFQSRSKTLMTLTGLSQKPIDLRIENFVRLFRATHFFGQEFQFLTHKFRDNSKLPEDTVSRMLAFQDYVEAIKKAGQVIEELKRRIKKEESKNNLLKDSLRSSENEVAQLKRSAKIIDKPSFVKVLSKQILEKIVSEQNLPIEIPKELDQKVVHEWRTSIWTRIDAINRNLQTIEKIEPMIPELTQNRQVLQGRISESTQKKEAIDHFKKDFAQKKKKIDKVDKELRQRLSDESNLSFICENLTWLLQTKGEYEQLKKQIAELDKNYHGVQIKSVEISPKIEKLKSEKVIINTRCTKLMSETKTLERLLNELGDFRTIVPRLLKAESHKEELESRLSEVEQKLENVKKALQAKRNEFNVVIDRWNRWKRKVDYLQQSQSELRTLLDNIEKYILANTCPVCGTLHKSPEELIEKLKLQRGKQPKQLEDGLKALENSEIKINELKKQINGLEINIERIEQKLKEIQKELTVTQKEVKTYVNRAIDLDISTTSENLIANINSRSESLSKQLNIKQQELSEQKSKERKKQEELFSLLTQQKSIQQELQTIESKQMQLKELIEKIRTEASSRRVSLELEKKTIQNNLEATRNNLRSLQEEIQKQQTQFKNFQKGISDLTNEIDYLKKEIHEIDIQISRLKRSIGEIESQIKRLDLNLDLDIEQLILHKTLFMEELNRLDSLLTEVTNFEIALDAAQMSASLAKAQKDKKDREKQIKNGNRGKQKLKDWLSYFSNIRKKLQSLQDQALSEYTAKYGPLASTIQKRLRSVYGFGEMELHPERGEIVVKVERRGQKGFFPSDYFSASQINIAALSLFLSSTLTQTWSSFAPILLDDPVTHFDDLNAYSFLDFIKGLLMDNEPGKGCQFIISTCEERLFRLMRQKFGKLNGRAIFYVFESIGEKGPRVERL